MQSLLALKTASNCTANSERSQETFTCLAFCFCFCFFKSKVTILDIHIRWRRYLQSFRQGKVREASILVLTSLEDLDPEGYRSLENARQDLITYLRRLCWHTLLACRGVKQMSYGMAYQ